MNQDYTNNDNCPPGHDDAGTRIKGGTRRSVDHNRKWLHEMYMAGWPYSVDEADARMNIIRQKPGSYDYNKGE